MTLEVSDLDRPEGFRRVAQVLAERGHPHAPLWLEVSARTCAEPHRAHVVASKSGLYGLIKALALELGPYNIRANLIALSTIENVRANPEWYPERSGGAYGDSELAKVPLRRVGKPQEVANVAVFLASDQSSYVTGDRIVCAGGQFM